MKKPLKKGKGGRARERRRRNGEGNNVYSATNMLVTTSCKIVRSGKKFKKNGALQETKCLDPLPIWMGHRDGTVGLVEDTEGDCRVSSQHDIDQ